MAGIYDHATDRTSPELAGLINDSFSAIGTGPVSGQPQGMTLTSHPVTTYKVDASNWDNPTRPMQAPTTARSPIVTPRPGESAVVFPNGYGDVGIRPDQMGYAPTTVERSRDNNGNYSDPLVAIAAAAGGVPLPRRDPRGTGGLVYTPRDTGGGSVPPGGDAWVKDRIGGESYAPRRGFTMGAAPNAPAVAGPLAARTSQPTQTVDATSRFLGDRGVNTAGLNISQVANELNKQMSGSSRDADGGRGFGVA